MNNRNRKNPTVIAWEQLRMLLVRFTERMSAFDSMVERQGRDIGVDEVYNEIQNIRSQLDQIQNGLNLYQNKINNERMVDKSQPQIPLTINNQTQNTGNSNDMNENRTMAKKQVIRLNENQLSKIVKESVNMVLKESFGSRLGQAFRSAKAGYKAEKSVDDYFANKPVTTAQSSLRSLIQYATYMQNNFDKVDLQKYANTLANIAQNLKTECEPFNQHETMVRFPKNPNKPGPLPYK